jgi:hypothetical protein
MPRPGTRAALKAAQQEQRFKDITHWFDRHAIVYRDERRALFRRVREQQPDRHGRWDGFYWFEVTLVAGNMLLVHGDIEHVLFAYHDAKSLDAAVNWLAQTKLGDPYVYEKASIGMRLRTLAHDRVHVAHAALRCARTLLWADKCPEHEAVHPCCLAKGHEGPHVAREDPGLAVVR